MAEIVAFVIPLLICAFVFIGIGIFSLNKKTPMHFWSGTTVKSEEITDIRAYNRANGIMWIVYGSTFILAIILNLVFNSNVGVLVVVLSCTVGLIALILVYGKIYNKYKRVR